MKSGALSTAIRTRRSIIENPPGIATIPRRSLAARSRFRQERGGFRQQVRGSLAET